MSKLSFRARALDASKPLPIYLADEIPETADCSLINRAVPQMPTGMEKEEESEHHLQRAICSGTVIPTPEVYDIEDNAYYGDLYPANIKMPRQLIYMQPFSMEADIPDYDMDSEDENWVNSQANRLEINPDKFEEMMDRLEKGSGQTVVTLQEAKALIKEDDDLIIAVYDYWLNKRLKTQHPLIPQVRTEARHGVTNHNPYIAFRRRTEKMQTRKNRKNDESSYEKMLKLKRDLSRALSLLEMVKRREKSKRELLHLSIEVFEKRYHAGDYSGQIVSEALQQRPTRPAFTPIFQPNSLSWIKEDSLISSLSRKEKRQYKKRRHKSSSKGSSQGCSSLLPGFPSLQGYGMDVDAATSEEESAPPASPSEEEEEDEGPFAFRRKADCTYQTPTENASWPTCAEDEGGIGDKRFRYFPTSLPMNNNFKKNGFKFVGFARRRIGRGGRVMLDRINCRGGYDAWRSLVFESTESNSTTGNESANQSHSAISSQGVNTEVSVDVPTDTSPPNSPPHVAHPLSPQLGCIHYRPKTPELVSDSDAMFDSLPDSQSLDVSSSLLMNEDHEDLSLLNRLPSSLFSSTNPEESPYIGVVVSGDDSPLVYNAHSLQPDPPLSRGDPLPRCMDGPSDSILLDESTANMVNASYLMEADSSDMGFDVDAANSWFNLDTPDPLVVEDSSTRIEAMDESEVSSSSPPITTTTTTTSNAPSSSSSPSVETSPPTAGASASSSNSSSDVNLSLVKVERTDVPASAVVEQQQQASSQQAHVKSELIVENSNNSSEECDETSSSVVDSNNTFNAKMRLLVDKDDKENARLLLPNKNEVVSVNSSSVVSSSVVVGSADSTSGPVVISENGGSDEILNILNSSEVCTIINSNDESGGRETTNVTSNCVLSTGQSSEHNHTSTEQGGLISAEGIAKAMFDPRGRANPAGNNGQTLAMKSYAFTAPTLVRGRPSNGVVVKRIGNGGNNAKTVVVEEV